MEDSGAESSVTLARSGSWHLLVCGECPSHRLCTSWMLFEPDLGAIRVYYCPEHGAVSSRCIVSTGRSDEPRRPPGVAQEGGGSNTEEEITP